MAQAFKCVTFRLAYETVSGAAHAGWQDGCVTTHDIRTGGAQGLLVSSDASNTSGTAGTSYAGSPGASGTPAPGTAGAWAGSGPAGPAGTSDTSDTSGAWSLCGAWRPWSLCGA